MSHSRALRLVISPTRNNCLSKFRSIRQRSVHDQGNKRSYHNNTHETSSHYVASIITTSALSAGLGWTMAKGLSTTRDSLADTIPPINIDNTMSTTPLQNARKPEHDLSSANLNATRDEIAAIVGKENITTKPDELERHTSSEWSSYPARTIEEPVLVISPLSTEEVSKVMKVCHKRHVPVVGFSGGTSLEGHFANTRQGICIDFTRMDKILKIHNDDLDVVVQPGVGYEQLNETLAQEKLFFPPDPGPGAMIGGMVGTGCSGTNAYRYGTMKNWVVSLTVVLADGTIIKTRQRPVKSSAGYDLTRLFIGSEGTLGLVTEAVLRVTVLPANERVAIAAFPSIRAATQCVDKVVQSGIQVAAVELMDELSMKCVNDSGATEREWEETPTLFFKFNGTEIGINEEISIVRQIAESVGNTGFIFANDAQENEDLWAARKTLLWASQSLKKSDDDHTWITDCAVPMSRLPEMIEQTKSDLINSGLVAAVLGHVGDGNFHTFIFYSDSQQQIAEDAVHRMVNRAIEMEGTITGEHGIGLVKRDYLPHEIGQECIDIMRTIKQALDPLSLLNPDKVIRVEEAAKAS